MESASALKRCCRVFVAIACAVTLAAGLARAKDKKMAPGGEWAVHSMDRPRPEVVDPGETTPKDEPGEPPSDAMVLFDGTDMSEWFTPREGKKTKPKWKVKDGYMEVVPETGSIVSKKSFGTAQVHLEFRTPEGDTDKGQGRGNSGVYLTGHCEIQVLDSYKNDTYPDGQCAAMYGRFPPMVNACRPPGEWQSYDIMFRAPEYNDDGELVQPAVVTVLHNGILVHHAAPTGGRAKEARLRLQDHKNTVRYRNIWVRPVEGYDAE